MKTVDQGVKRVKSIRCENHECGLTVINFPDLLKHVSQIFLWSSYGVVADYDLSGWIIRSTRHGDLFPTNAHHRRKTLYSSVTGKTYGTFSQYVSFDLQLKQNNHEKRTGFLQLDQTDPSGSLALGQATPDYPSGGRMEDHVR